MRLLFILCLATFVSGCQTNAFMVYFNDSEVTTSVGYSLKMCKASVRFHDNKLTIDGISGPDGKENITKTFSISKIGWESNQVEQIDRIALVISNGFKERCENAVELRPYPTQLAEYLKSQTPFAENILKLLLEAEKASEANKEPEEVLTIAGQAISISDEKSSE